MFVFTCSIVPYQTVPTSATMSKNSNKRQTERYSLEESLFMAIFKADHAAVKSLLDRGVNLNVFCSAGHTPLGTAAHHGLTDIVKLLLNYQPPSKPSSDDRESLFSRRLKGNAESGPTQDDCADAVKGSNRGFFIMVHNDGDESVAPGENRDEGDHGKPIDENLNEAVTPDDMDKLEWDFEEISNEEENEDAWYMMYRFLGRTSAHLDETECLVNQEDSHGRTAVHYAAQEGQIETLKILLKAGAAVHVRDKLEITPLHLAAANNHPVVVSMLLAAGHWKNSPDLVAAFHIAAARGHSTVVHLLLDANVNINAQDENGRTPLLLAACKGHYSVVDLLLRRGAKVNIEDHSGKTPLCLAAKMLNVKMTERLLEAGARLTLSDHLLHCAVLYRQPDLARLLLKAGAMTNQRDGNGDTPLILASRIGHVELAEILIERVREMTEKQGAMTGRLTKLKIKNVPGAVAGYPNIVSGVTPLHEAVECIRESQFAVFRNLVQTLRKGGARLDVESLTSGDTPLLRAMILNKPKFAALLVKLGANVNQVPLHPCHIDVLALLRRAGNMTLVQLFVAAGLKLKHRFEDDATGEKRCVNAWLRCAASNSMSLANLCRIVIRNRYKDKINEVVATSMLPKTVKRFLMFDEIISFDGE